MSLIPEARQEVPPAKEPISLKEAKQQLRVDHSDEDDFIERLIVLAREWAEGIAGRTFIQRTSVLFEDAWPADGVVVFPRPPFIELVEVRYKKPDLTIGTKPITDFEIDPISEPGRARLVEGKTFEEISTTWNSVEWSFLCGYGLEPEDVPEIFRQAMLLKISDLYENRETLVVGTSVAETGQAVDLLDQDRIRDGNYTK